MPATENRIPELAPRDLQDPTLFRLNMILQFLAEQVARAQGQAGPVSFSNPLTLPQLSVLGKVSYPGLMEFADNAEAVSGGLKINDLYRTATGEVRVVI